jgi:putative oxidoreductase
MAESARPVTARDFGLLIIRVGLGICFILHGWPKVSQNPYTWTQIGQMAHMAHPRIMGMIGAHIEFLGGILLAAGFLMRPVALLLFAQMMVAIFCVHLRATGDLSTFAAGYSHALEDGVVFLGLVFLGAGKFSVDSKLFG